MIEAKPNVTFLSMTENAKEVIFAAFKQCYARGSATNEFYRMMDAKRERNHSQTRAMCDFITWAMSLGHESPLEHVVFNFAVQGISRACSHQLVRHRIGVSVSQQSQRYVEAGKDMEVIVPPSIKNLPGAMKVFEQHMEEAQKRYEELQRTLIEAGYDQKRANEDARFVLPNAAETKMVVSFNVRSLLHFLELRCCERAQWEIRKVAGAMLAIVKELIPEVFEKAGAPCVRKGYCPEGQMGCGKAPTLQEVLDAYASGKGNAV